MNHYVKHIMPLGLLASLAIGCQQNVETQSTELSQAVPVSYQEAFASQAVPQELPWQDLFATNEQGEWEHFMQVNLHEDTIWFEERNGERVLCCSGIPTGLLRSQEVYRNFIVEFEWRHLFVDGMRANAGFFLWSDALPALGLPFSRSIEVQIANFEQDGDWYTSHGDVFAIHGATMVPDPRFGWPKPRMRSMPLECRASEPGEWTKYRLTCINGVIQLEVNGVLVSGGYNVHPSQGHLMIESEGGQMEMRRMRVAVLEAKGEVPIEDQAQTLSPDQQIINLLDPAAEGAWAPGNLQSRDWRWLMPQNVDPVNQAFAIPSGQGYFICDIYQPVAGTMLIGSDLTLPAGWYRFEQRTTAEGVQQALAGQPIAISSEQIELQLQSNSAIANALWMPVAE